MKNPLVSCVIPTYNRSDKVVHAINSIQNQTYNELEIIVVDDQSKDNTKEVVNKLAKDDQRIQYHLNPNKGANNARNHGIYVAKGDFIAFLDDDDSWMKDKIEIQVNLITSNRNLGMVFTAFERAKNKNDRLKRHPNKYVQIKPERILNRILNRNFITTSTILVRKKVFEIVGSFNPKYSSFQDWELITRIAAEYEIGYINEVKVTQYESSDSITRNKHGRIITSIMHLKQFMYLYETRPNILSKRYRRLSFKLLKLNKLYFAELLAQKSIKIKPLSVNSYLLLLIIKLNRLVK